MEPLVAMTLCCAAGWAGDELRASATVNVVSTCAANTVIPDGSYASMVGTVFSGTVNIQVPARTRSW